jgi:uncharacterized protein YlxW (UPF0749 family)
MHPFEFALALIAMILIYKAIKVVFWQNRTASSRRDEAVGAELTERLRQLEERVQVLERIVTDERYDLKREFKDLGGN